jgi:hypothetical protein
MIIITIESFESSFQRLADYHTQNTDVETYIE